MELSSSINKTWNMSIYLSLAGCIILVLFLNHTHSKLNLIGTSGELSFNPPSKMKLPLEVVTQNVAINHINEEKNNVTINLTVKNSEIGAKKTCNIFEGRWVYKPDQQPSYDANRCTYIDKKFRCQENGRPDSGYEKWRWEATDCDLPLFDGIDMLERLRNKRMIIVGDSLNRNLWESLACLLHSSVLPSGVEVKAYGQTTVIFKAKDYNCTVEFYWSPFLVELNETHESGRKVLVLDKVSPLSEQWRGAYVMVFNSAHWWTHSLKIRAFDLFQYEGKLIKEIAIEEAYERGMKTWANWMENNVDPKETRVFFRSISAVHYMKHSCHNATQPMVDTESYESSFTKSLIQILETLIKGMTNLHVNYLNITKLSQYRIDAHPSIYWSMPPKSADCSHWCLPGLPDTWNRLLYASLVLDTS